MLQEKSTVILWKGHRLDLQETLNGIVECLE